MVIYLLILTLKIFYFQLILLIKLEVEKIIFQKYLLFYFQMDYLLI
ncbi:Uncharacterised protein [Providencia rustigianii]|nr:Uncharacterised protein [Providencia rustigianii]